MLSRRNLFLALGMITAVLLTSAALIASTAGAPSLATRASITGGQG